MGQVTVTVNGHPYQVGCDDGEEAHVEYLAEYVGKRVAELTASVGQVGEARLLLLAALLIADDLSNLYDRMEAAEKQDGQMPQADFSALAGLADRLESVADQIEKA
ncbi:MAG: cell division protein ZapA [Minwuiales bacterium]|nr:cell division protein ZapA [Minwuiales bacterium]